MVSSKADTRTVTVRCPAGALATGGGGYSDNRTIDLSYPLLEGGKPVGWTVVWNAPRQPRTTYVICMG